MEQVHHNVKKEQEKFRKAKRIFALFTCLLIGFLIGCMYMKSITIQNVHIKPLWEQFTATTDIQIQKDLAIDKNELLEDHNCHSISYRWEPSSESNTTPYRNGAFICFFW
jgi:hypothetical protein